MVMGVFAGRSSNWRWRRSVDVRERGGRGGGGYGGVIGKAADGRAAPVAAHAALEGTAACCLADARLACCEASNEGDCHEGEGG